MKKIVSVLMAILMTLSLLPTTAWAAAAEPSEPVQQEVLQSEEPVQQEEVSQEEEQLPELTLAEPDTEEDENIPAVLSTSGNLASALEREGFQKAEINEDYTVDVPSWGNYTGLAALSCGSGEMTLTLKSATAEAWNAAYSQSRQWFPNVLDEVNCVIPYFTPNNATQYAYYIDDEDSEWLLDFVNGGYEDRFVDVGNGCNMGFAIAKILNVEGQEYIYNTGSYTRYFLVVWRDNSGEIVGKYSLKVNIETEESFSHPQTGSDTMMAALKKAGFNTTPTWDTQVQVTMPDGLVKGTDYTLDYNKETGHISIKLMPGDPDHWAQAYETLLQWNEESNWPEGNDIFYVMLGFPNPSSAKEVLMYPGSSGYSLGLLAQNVYDWDYAAPIKESGGQTGWSLGMGSAGVDENGNAHISLEKGVVFAECYVAVYGNGNGQLISQNAKRAVSVSIVVTEDFSYEWNTRNLEDQLKNAGFTAPEKGSISGDHKDFYLRTPWQDSGCVSFDYDDSGSVGKLTVTLKPATLARWKALYEAEQNNDFGFHDSLDVNIRSDAPAGTVRGAGALIWEAGCTNVVQDFLDGNLNDYMEPFRISGGYDGFGRYFPLISVEKRDGKVILSAESGETYYRYLMVWDNDNDDSSRLAQHNLFITVKVEGDIHYEWDVNTTMGDALRNAGYRVPNQDLFGVDMPDGLTEGVDYTYSYDASTGHVSIQLLKSKGWMKAFETCYDQNGDYASDYFGITTCFNQPSSSATQVKFYMTDDDDSVVRMYANNNLSRFYWDSGTFLRPGSMRTIIGAGADNDENMWISAQPGTYWVRCIAVWGDGNGNILRDSNGTAHKYMYTVSIEVPQDFDYEWNSRPIEDQLADAGFTAPKMDKQYGNIPGALNLEMPKGMESGIDYRYAYYEETGELYITILRGSKADWKAAYLESITDERSNTVDLGVNFLSVDNAVRGVSWIGDEDGLRALLQDDIWDSDDAFNIRGDYTMCGGRRMMASVQDKGDGTVTISSRKGTTEFYQAVMWKDAAGNVLAKHLIKVTINFTSFSHTAVAAPVIDSLNAADAARVKMELYAPDSLMTCILAKGKVTLVPKAGASLTDKTGDVGGFWVQAPAGYTLQSGYLNYGPGQNADLNDFETGRNGYWIPVDFYNDLDTVVTLRWKNNNADAADLIESFEVCIDSNWGKLSSSGGSPNALDVAAIYECLTQDKTPACGDKAACDVNLDGDVDVFDLQYLYEYVAQGQ